MIGGRSEIPSASIPDARGGEGRVIFVGMVSMSAVEMRRCQGGGGADSLGAACRNPASVELVVLQAGCATEE